MVTVIPAQCNRVKPNMSEFNRQFQFSRQNTLIKTCVLFVVIIVAGQSVFASEPGRQAGDLDELLSKGLTAYKQRNYSSAWQILRPLADKGVVEAQRKIGVMYRHGLGVAKNDKEAIIWYRKAASQGHVKAQNSLGVMYRFGLGVEKNPDEALKWLTAAAEQGDGKGQENLGLMLMEDPGITPDDNKAVYWLDKAARQGHIRAQFSLGLMLLAGRGIPQDNRMGMAWIRRAAESGHPQAAQALAKAYSDGLYGLGKDAAQAQFWYKRAGKRMQ